MFVLFITSERAVEGSKKRCPSGKIVKVKSGKGITKNVKVKVVSDTKGHHAVLAKKKANIQTMSK